MRSTKQKILDFITFPFRAVTLFFEDKWGLSSQATERFDYVAKEVQGYCLDIGCGPHNRFVREFLNNHGIGIDVYKYEGLSDENIVDMTNLPYENDTFDTVTFIANINHIPKSLRDIELSEAYRVLKSNGRVIITMGNPIAEILVHFVINIYDHIFKTNHNLDRVRGMAEEEDYFVLDSEIIERVTKAGFKRIQKKYFFTQWGLNHLFVAYKD